MKVIRVIRRRCDVKSKVRTYCRKLRAAYLKFSKKRKKTKAMVRLVREKLLREKQKVPRLLVRYDYISWFPQRQECPRWDQIDNNR
ncbi:MAG: hypothetical protein IPN19_04080 [Elusimicrobia bacterium]|nr:hypothetical protein [Elusimicrobiota bacterium]